MKVRGFFLFLPVIFALDSGCSKAEPTRTSTTDKQALAGAFPSYDASKAFLLNPYFVLYSDQTVSPSQAEVDDWKTSRRGSTGAVTKPLDPVYFDYPDESLDAWASRGDPIAKYIKAYKLYNAHGCSKERDVITLLLEAFASESEEVFTLEGKSRPEKRLPEAAMVAAVITEQCAGRLSTGKSEEYKSMARLGGWYFESMIGKGE